MLFGVSTAQSLAEYGGIHGDILTKVSPLSVGVRTDSFIGESVIIVLPAELSFDVAARSQALACFNNLQIGNFVKVDMAGSIEVFLGD